MSQVKDQHEGLVIDPSNPEEQSSRLQLGVQPEACSARRELRALPSNCPESAKVAEWLQALLGDTDFLRAIDFAAQEAMRNWELRYDTAFRAVLSALAEPRHLEPVFDAWINRKQSLVRLIVRRRMFDLFRKEASRVGHTPHPLSPEGEDAGFGVSDDTRDSNPLRSLLHGGLIRSIQMAMVSFAARGRAQHKQARLLLRRFLDGASYAELSDEMGCSVAALRVRVHKAINAIRRHIAECHPELVTAVSTQVA